MDAGRNGSREPLDFPVGLIFLARRRASRATRYAPNEESMHPAQIAAYHIHYLLAIVLAIYGFAALWLDSRLKKNQPISHATRQAHKQYAITVKVMQYLTIITLLTGLYLLSYKLRAIADTTVPYTAFMWAYIKVFLFLALTGIMGALGSIPLKKRLHALESGGIDGDLQKSTAKKLHLFKLLQLVLIVLMFGLGTYKPSPVKIQRVDPSQQQPAPSGETTVNPSADPNAAQETPPVPESPAPGTNQ
ncbi:MAG: hypothetical protein CMN76_05450 [Spirochaetaceae bacterium]|nr:hypothetical protein [Spirochaetaceae bacterium]|tara:strand:+ start:114692 stop:115432 length:741 start_codon:yes stop_codon:yes gene_type:complete